MEPNVLQIAFVIFFGFFINLDRYGLHFNLWQPVVGGTIVGLILGDMQTGMYIGASLQLMTLGVSQFGGASVPDYATAAVVGTFIAITTGQSRELGVTLGIPVALLMVQLDVLKMTINIFFQHEAEKAVQNGDYKKIGISHWIATVLTMCSTGVPILLCVLMGPTLVDFIVNRTPEWLIGGLTVAGGLLPVMGLGILLRYLPTRDYLTPLIVGFVLVAYFEIPIMGVALLGGAWALHVLKTYNKNNGETVGATTTTSYEGVFDEDE
ncbi:PTS mannose/fructose/sorbose/N-acetylgalactosamine transporter subunit IIC [Enterococcus pallens]|uniref:PTS system mannose/fructose/sorbose-specific IIC component n=1 Tax=Enterococcus pallens ATCC BAA-351 TaxID=1158607 RepID=R2QCV1_9ENTE|nr:PTS sugar transporter subunit IIC [Enterococcus pallens]EOH93063.1 hypothetical protein UAU_02705 [Enterococcus pallens ATCC BAA-351]EOU24849.1 hypothetical protein I588_00836 [Enterococcus pallens ATCC BAA-351]OJG76137.1 hypothetical protein RV10_GL004198 [Enterococcus pallens]